MDINTIQDRIIAEFENLSDKMSKFSYFKHIRKLTSENPSMDAAEKNNENLVRGCKKKIWITAKLKDGKIYFKADSDNSIYKGLVNMLLKVYSGNTPTTIANTDLYFLHEIRLFNYLSSTWRQDFLCVVQRIKSLAIRNHLNSYSNQ